MRARQPETTGSVTRDGVRVVYDVYGEDNSPTVLLLPTWVIAQAAHWKFQIPLFARRFRVVSIEGRGNGRSDRPTDPAAYTTDQQVADAVAVMDATATDRAVVAGVSMGGVYAAALAAQHPDRVLGAVMIGSSFRFLSPPHPGRALFSFTDVLDTDEGWALYNEHAWRRDLPKFAEFFWSNIFSEPHSTKHTEDGVGWTLETDAEVLVATMYARGGPRSRDEEVAGLEAIPCPTLFIHGTDDAIAPVARSEAAAAITGGDLLLVEGGGHCPQGRDPIRVNRSLVEFIDRVTPQELRTPQRTAWTRALNRPKRVLYLSSPIGLGHARRDLAVARSLRELHDDVQVDWLAQHPVTTFLADTGERVHPASSYLVSESGHIESEAHEHDLHAFQAIRRMDEILIANFSIVQDVVDGGDYDLVIGDETWDLDYCWHENPELKRASYVWMTDFVGWLPMPDGGEHEARLTADYNAEMIEHVERFKRVRDRSIFVGEPDDVVPDRFGPGLPSIREWTEQHYEFSGYITGLDNDAHADRSTLRQRLGYDVDQPLVVVTVGGSGVGVALLRKVIDAYPRLRKEVDGLRMVVVAGPRVGIDSLPRHDGVDVRGFVPDLPLHLAACDAAIVQGGLTTTMELVALGRPFVYFPLGHHFEQQRHVRHRLDRHGAGQCLDYADSDADDIAAALVSQLDDPVPARPVPPDGAARAARSIADLL